MKPLILAAGRGVRLRDRTENPKCLLEVGGRSLVGRYLDALTGRGLRPTIVAGYRADTLRAHVEVLGFGTQVDFLFNPDFEEGSIISLARGLAGHAGPLLLMDGDVLFHPALVDRLLDSPQANALLVDRASSFTDEEYIAGMTDGRVLTLRRGPVPEHTDTGEWVGFVRYGASETERLRALIEAQIAGGERRIGYEDAMARLLHEVDVRAVGVDGLPWLEIDSPADLRRAGELARQIDVVA